MIAPFYQDAEVVIYNADYRDVLPLLGPAHHVITDPPYDLATHAGARTLKAAADEPPHLGRSPLETLDAQLRATGVRPMKIDFAPLDVATVVPQLLGHASRWALAFCGLEMLGDYRRAAGDAWVRAGFWRRVDGAPQFSGDRPAQPGEGIAIMHRSIPAGRVGPMRWNGGGRHAFYEDLTVKRDRVHVAQKPETLLAKLILDYTSPGDLILDPFAGSGTTGVAAKRLGRLAILIDVDPAACANAAYRMRQPALGLFAAGGA